MADFYLDELKYSLEAKTSELRTTCYRISILGSNYDSSPAAENALKYLCLKAEALSSRIAVDRDALKELENPLSLVQKLVRSLRAVADYFSIR